MKVTKISDILDYQLNKYPLEKSVSGKREDNSDYSFGTEEIKLLVNRFSSGLLKKGLNKGDKISLISYNNRPEWNVADFGMLQIGVVNVSVYPNISPEDYIYIFNNAKVKYCIVGYGDLLNKVLLAQEHVPSLKRIFTFDNPAVLKDFNGNKIESWETLLDENPDETLIERSKNGVDEDDLATIIYTSGATGIPKGVMLSHKNLTTNIKAISETILLDKGDVALSYLPICHGFERTFMYCYVYKSIEVHYALNPKTVGESIAEIRPHIITAVPRVLEKIYEKIFFSVQKSGWLKRKLFSMSEQLALQFDFNKKYSFRYRLKFIIADKFVFSKITKKLGGRIKIIGVGASACPQKIQKFFCAAGIPVREGYGLTETSAVLSVNHIPSRETMLGTVGIVLPGFELKIESEPGIYETGEGEIFVRGISVTKGYYNDPVKTAEAFNKDGWFMTGDIGKIVKNEFGFEFIKLTNRKKELLKSSYGKYIAPAAIENLIRENSFISQAMIVGDRRKYVSAIIIPEYEALKDFACKHKTEFRDNRELIKLNFVKELFGKIIDEANKHLSHHEQIKKYVLLPQSWTVESGELTPTLKLKRKTIEDKYAGLIEQLYENGLQNND